MASKSIEPSIARRADAHGLALMLRWTDRSYWMLPIWLLLCFLAARQGQGMWAAAWLMVWLTNGLRVGHVVRRLRSSDMEMVGRSLCTIQREYAIAGGMLAALIPAYLVNMDDVTLLVVTMLFTIQGCTAVISSSGILGGYIGFMAPAYVLLIGGWLWRGQWLGWTTACLIALCFPFAVMAVRSQRSAVETLLRLLDANEKLSQELGHERDRVEAASQTKTRFFAAASHDLRQPLHALSVNAATLDVIARRASDNVLREVSKGIDSALRQSRTLLDGLLDISRLDAHTVEVRVAPHDLGAILHAVRDQYAALAAQKGLTIETVLPHEPMGVTTDADQLLRILGNLVDNAIKFTDQGSVTLSGWLEGDHVVASVVDTGPGIAPCDRERVFEEFFQGSAASRDTRMGLGLGLSIVQRTAALLGIGLHLQDGPQGGTRFELKLQPAIAPSASKGTTQGSEHEAASLSVLLVDDEPAVLTSMCTYFQQLGWTARCVSTGADAEQAMLAGLNVDIAVIDLGLRGEDGLDVLKKLRHFRPLLPAVIVTGNTSHQGLGELSGSSAKVLHKPVDGRQLSRVLSSMGCSHMAPKGN